jgi:hypothetical protein
VAGIAFEEFGQEIAKEPTIVRCALFHEVHGPRCADDERNAYRDQPKPANLLRLAAKYAFQNDHDREKGDEDAERPKKPELVRSRQEAEIDGALEDSVRSARVETTVECSRPRVQSVNWYATDVAGLHIQYDVVSPHFSRHAALCSSGPMTGALDSGVSTYRIAESSRAFGQR